MSKILDRLLRAASDRDVRSIVRGFDLSQPWAVCVCPCGGTYAVGIDKAERALDLYHSLPVCDPYDKLSILDFLTYARRSGARMLDGASGYRN